MYMYVSLFDVELKMNNYGYLAVRMQLLNDLSMCKNRSIPTLYTPIDAKQLLYQIIKKSIY